MSAEEEKEAERAHKNLLDFAKTTKDDLYALLSLTPPSFDPSAPTDPPSQNEIRTAWRRTAFSHHPDRNRGNEIEAATRLDTARKAFEVLHDPTARAVYDNTLRAAAERAAREGQIEGRRKELINQLVESEKRAKEDRAAGIVRPVGVPVQPDISAREKRAREISAKTAAFLANLNEHRRKQHAEAVERKRRRTGHDHHRHHTSRDATPSNLQDPFASHVDEADCTIRTTWRRGTPAGDALDKERLRGIFSRFGTVDGVVVMNKKEKDKNPTKPDSSGTETTTAAIVFSSVIGAHAAITDAPFLHSSPPPQTPEWAVIERVEWWNGLGPPEEGEGAPSVFEKTVMQLREAQREKEISEGLGFGGRPRISYKKGEVPTFKSYREAKRRRDAGEIGVL